MSQAWSPHKSHVNTPVPFSFSFLPLCRSGYWSAVTLSCNKCFEGRRPNIVLEIMRHMYVCVCMYTHRSHTQELTFCSLTTNTPLLILLSWFPRRPGSTLPLPFSSYISPQLATKTELILSLLTGLTMVDCLMVQYLLLTCCTPGRLSYHWRCDTMIWSLLLPLIPLHISESPFTNQIANSISNSKFSCFKHFCFIHVRNILAFQVLPVPVLSVLWVT